MNTLAACMVVLWVTGWIIAAVRAGLRFRTATCPGSRDGCAGINAYSME